MSRSYIGITDFTNSNEVCLMRDALKQYGGATNRHLLHVGVMMSRKTLNDLPSRWQNVFPDKKDVAKIFVKDESIFNVLHYADYDGVDVANNLAKATLWGGENMDALQLDMIWPDPVVIKTHRRNYPDKKIILQINSKSLAMVDNEVGALIHRLELYKEGLDYVLLDMSMGRGRGLSAEQLLPYLVALDNFHTDFELAVAGGLCAETLLLIEPLIKRFPRLSIDAQSRLRPSSNSLNPIDWAMAKNYLQCAIEMFSKQIK